MERITELIQHPERMDRDTLYELRSLCALYPYYQTVRLLMLQNLYLLHDPTFDEELRRAAIYITDRRVLFNMIEASHYQLKPQTSRQQNASAATAASKGSRTMSLIDNFLDSIPKEEEDTTKKKRKPTPADAAIDYVAYLLDTEEESEAAPEVPEMPGQQLIDTFINSDKPKFVLSEAPSTGSLSVEIDEIASEGVGEEYFTETLARIYIKQGRYSKALEIIQRLSLQFPKKNAYFADQKKISKKDVHTICNSYRDCSSADDRYRTHSGVKRWRPGFQLLFLQPDRWCPQDYRLHREDHLGPCSCHGGAQRSLRICCSSGTQRRVSDGGL